MTEPLTWTFQPDWSDAILERFEWATAILSSITGAQQSIATRYAMRRSLEARFLLSDRERTFMNLLLQRRGNEEFRVPLWFHRAKLGSAAIEGATALACDTVNREFRAGDFGLLVGADAFSSETVEINAVSDTELTLASGLVSDWPAGTVIHPLRTARLKPGGMQQPTSRVMLGNIRFDIDAGEDVDGGAETFPIYAGLPILSLETNWADAVDVSFDWLRDEFDSKVGLRVFADTAGRAFRTTRLGLMINGRSEHAAFRNLLRRLRGRQGALWIPSHGRDVTVAEAALSGAGELEIERIGLTEAGGISPDIAHLLFTDGTAIEWTGLVAPGNPANERLSLAGALSRDFSVGERAQFIQVSRLDQDVITVRHETDSDGVATCALAWSALDETRSGAADGHYPIETATMNSTPCGVFEPSSFVTEFVIQLPDPMVTFAPGDIGYFGYNFRIQCTCLVPYHSGPNTPAGGTIDNATTLFIEIYTDSEEADGRTNYIGYQEEFGWTPENGPDKIIHSWSYDASTNRVTWRLWYGPEGSNMLLFMWGLQSSIGPTDTLDWSITQNDNGEGAVSLVPNPSSGRNDYTDAGFDIAERGTDVVVANLNNAGSSENMP